MILQNELSVSSQITWFYFNNLAEADEFFQQTLRLKPVLDQGWAKIYAVAEKAFVGAVDASQGSLQALSEHDVLFTLVVNNVEAWHRHIKASNMTEVTEISGMKDAPIRTFFAKGPGGYVFEFQAFLNQADQEIFH